MVYVYASGLGVSRPAMRKMKLSEELFLFCLRLRVGLFEFDLAERFSIHISTVSGEVVTCVNFFIYFSW